MRAFASEIINTIIADDSIPISKESTEEEINKWLQQILGFTKEELEKFQNFQYLDGRTLIEYKDSSALDLKRDLSIPLGIARKILLYSNESNRTRIEKYAQYEMAKWTIADVQTFIRSSVTVKTHDIDEICQLISDEYVDGIVFISYENSREMQSEFHGGDKFGVIYKRILAKRDDLISREEYVVDSKDERKSFDFEENPTNKQAISNSNDEDVSRKWSSYIRNVLNLNVHEENAKRNESNTVKTCSLKIIHCDWKNRNALEKNLLFLLLIDENEIADEDKFSSSLWDRIRKHLYKWRDHFLPECKYKFEIKKEDILVLNKKPISLSKGKVKMRFLMEKTLEELVSHENVFLLINRNLLRENIDNYTANIRKSISRKIKSLEINFSFATDRSYWIFDPDDFSFGFRLENIQVNLCGNPGKCFDEKENKKSPGNEKDDQNKHSPPPAVCQNKNDNVDERLDYKSEAIISPAFNIQIQRRFKGNSSEIQYHEGWRISTPEHDGSVSFLCNEFKFVPGSLIKKGFTPVSNFMNKEIIRFACGCLNARKNGTIMFGIGDSQGTVDGKNTNIHGEIIGVPIGAIEGDFIAEFIESLRIGIQQCFETNCSWEASKCISNPVFVKVNSKLPSYPKFVVEVDIEPSSSLCKNMYFKVNRSKIVKSKDVEKEYTLFVREDMGTVKKSKDEERLFLQTNFKDIIQKRKEDESQMLSGCHNEPIELPMDKLRKFMCKGSNKIEKNIWPILVINKPTDEQKQDQNWMKCLKFLKAINFHAVFDFDDESNTNGICAMCRNKEKSILQDEEIFFEFSGNKQELSNKLGMPHDMKTVWIFSNGRRDEMPPKPSQKGEKWTNMYSAGIRDAVIFYSKNDIIPKGRAIVILLLFSNNLDGLVETFHEITVRFSWEQIAIIATDDILTRFISESREIADKIIEHSISGKSLTWEHVNSTFLEISGCEEQCNILLTTSAGALVPADEKFIETLTEFHIISAKQCENKKFKSAKEEEEYSSEMELQFYRGEKVGWYNFFFGNHVLKRHCFDRLKTSIQNLLQSNRPSNDIDKKIVATVIIAHEPGAGGTTLSRHILWEFHKHYRCAIITKITERTADNVLALWRHKEANHAKPLLLLIDELQQSDLRVEDLMRQIHMKYRSYPLQVNLICCFLICQRENEIIDHSLDHNGPISYTGNVIEHLKQKLTDTEIQWMDKKYEKLEKKGAEYKPEYLLSFMILREGFSQEYIKNTIKQFLTHIDMRSNEFELLEYASLVSSYAPTSRRGPNVFIPLECCDELMGSRLTKTIFWEKNMSTTLKMFLIIEQKETASGMQIRMAHPALADAVLSQILENKKIPLSSLTLRFLDSAILQSSSYGRAMIIDFTKEMLVRRLKEEYNDDKTTSFSPLIENICQNESWTFAKEILRKGFEMMKDTYVAQTLARLCSKHKDFEDGISWAKLAVKLSVGNKNANGYCHHTLAIVLDELFNYETKKLHNISPHDATKHIEIILEALDHFLEASRLRIGSADHILYPIIGVLGTIIKSLKFMHKNVKFLSDVDIKRFITDETYMPSEIEDWNNFKPKFLRFSNEGEKAFAIVEQCLCFNTTFYAHDRMSSFPTITKEHRLYRNLHYQYPDLFNDFRSFFGANEDDGPMSNMPEVLNNWHRRRLISLGGNSYMNICDILRQIKARTKQFNKADAIRKCVEIKYHIQQITERTPRDLANLISVNVVLGLLGGEKRDSATVILDYCKQIVKMKRDYQDVAYLFICILLWPSCEMDVEYDDDLFFESLIFLHRNKEIKQGKPRDFKYVFLKEERNVTQPTTQFFLTNGKGFKSICHRFDIFFREGAESQFNNAMWENFRDKHNLKRMKGFLKFNEGKSCIRLESDNTSSERYIEIRKIRTGKKEFLSEEEVYFYLGFSIGGPIAYNVKPTRHEDLSNYLYNPVQLDDKVELLLEETEETLQRKLDIIKDLKSKERNGRKLKMRDRELLKEEDDIRTALDIKRTELYNIE